MAVSSVTIFAPVNGISVPVGIVRPQMQMTFAGGTPNYDIEWVWDDDPTFANGNGRRVIENDTGITTAGTYTKAPSSDLDVADGRTFYLRVTVTDNGGGGTPVADSNNSIVYFDPNPATRTYLYLLQSIGVGFTPTDDPTGGWGTGIGGTQGPDGDVTDYRRYLYHLQNIGVGFSRDEPGAGWGPNSPSTDAPDGINENFARYLYLLQNIDATQPCPYIYSLSQTVVSTGESLVITGQGLVSATNPTPDAWDAEVRLYEAASFAAAYTVLTITDWTAGDTDTITVTIPGGAASGFIAVVHTTTPSCSGSNFRGLTVIAVEPDIEAGWWVEVWNLRNTTRIISPLPDVIEANLEHVASDIGKGFILLPRDHPDIPDILDRTTSPPTQRLVKVYQHNRFAYSFIPEDIDEDFTDDGAAVARIYGDGQESMLNWGRALWADSPSNPSETREWLYGSDDNAISWGDFEPQPANDNGGFEDGSLDPFFPFGSANLFTLNSEFHDGAWGCRVINTALNTDGIQFEVGVYEDKEAFVDIWVSNKEGGSKTFVMQMIDDGPSVVDSDTVVTSSAAWNKLTVSWVPDLDQTVTIRVIQTAGAIGQFWVDDAYAYVKPDYEFSYNRCLWGLSRDHVAEGLHSLKIAADANGDVTFNGVVAFIQSDPGQKYTIRVPITGTPGHVWRIAARMGGVLAQEDHTIVGPLGTFDIVTLEGTTQAEEVSIRFAISSKNSAASTAWFDDITVYPGEAAADGGTVITDIHTAMAARGALDFVLLNFSTTLDSSGQAWPVNEKLSIPPEWSLWDILEHLIGLGYRVEFAPINWREGGDTGWELSLFAPNNAGVDYSGDLTGPAILPGDTIHDAKPSSAGPLETVVYAEGQDGIWTVAEASASEINALERREAFIINQAAQDAPTIYRAALERLTLSAERGAQYTANMSIDGDPLPYFDFVPLDRLRSHLPSNENRDHVPDSVYQAASIVSRLTADGTRIEYQVDWGNYRMTNERVTNVLLNRMLHRASTENYRPGTGRVRRVRLVD